MHKGLVNFSLSGKSILVTGATGHLGRAISWALATAGANVLVNSRYINKSEKLVSEITRAGLYAESAVFDVTKENEIEQFFEGRGGCQLNGLINNAYAGGGGTVETADLRDFQKSYEMTVGCANCTLKYALPGLRLAVAKYNEASVINIASMYGMVSPDLRIYDTPHKSNPPFYGAAKAALIQWTKYAACEFGAEGIRVNSISPGPFPSDEVQKSTPELVKRLANKVPMRRVGVAQDLGGAVIFLSSPASSFVSGINLPVDGGWTAW